MPKALTNQEYLVDRDASVQIVYKVLPLANPLQSISYQFIWDETVKGRFHWEATNYDPSLDRWEPLFSCGDITFFTSDNIETLSNIVVLPHIWLSVGFIRWIFTPDAGSIGNISAAIRTVPS